MPRYRLTTFQIPMTITLMVQRDDASNINLVSLPLDLELEDVEELLVQALDVTRDLIANKDSGAAEHDGSEQSVGEVDIH